MRILHYFPHTMLQEGGTVRAALDISTTLARRGQDMVWLTCDGDDVPEVWGPSGTPGVVMIGSPQRLAGRLSASQLALAADEIAQADVVHLHAMWTPSNPQIARECHRLNTPWILSSHGMLDDWCMDQRGLKKRIYLATAGRSMVRGASMVLMTAEEERRQAGRWIPHDRTCAIPLIMDMDPYGQMPDPKASQEAFGTTDAPTILFLSRIHPKKSLETLIDAVHLLHGQGNPARLLVAGTGDDVYAAAMKRRAQDHGLADHVSFLGMVVGDLKLSLYAMADVFALPTQQENFGLVYPEALLCGTPVITTRGTDIWRELEESGGSVIVKRDAQAFADALTLLVTDEARRDEMGRAGRAWVLEWLDSDAVGARYEEMYESAISAR